MVLSHQWDSVKYVADEPVYFSALHTPEDIFCEGSDAEDGPAMTREKRARYEEAAYEVLRGDIPIILSAALKGPTSGSRWANPWRYRPAHRPDWWQPESDDMLFTRANVLKWAKDCGRGHLSPAEALAWCKAEAQAERDAISEHAHRPGIECQFDRDSVGNYVAAGVQEKVDGRSLKETPKYDTDSEDRTAQVFDDTYVLKSEANDSMTTLPGNATRSKKRPIESRWIKSNVPKRARGETLSPTSTPTPTPVHKSLEETYRPAHRGKSVSTSIRQSHRSTSSDHVRSEEKIQPEQTNRTCNDHSVRSATSGGLEEESMAPNSFRYSMPSPTQHETIFPRKPASNLSELKAQMVALQPVGPSAESQDSGSQLQLHFDQNTHRSEGPNRHRLSQGSVNTVSACCNLAGFSDLEVAVTDLANAQRQQDKLASASLVIENDIVRTPVAQDSQASYITEIAPSTKGIGTFRYKKRKQKDSRRHSSRETQLSIASRVGQNLTDNDTGPDMAPRANSEDAHTSLPSLPGIQFLGSAPSTYASQDVKQVGSRNSALKQDSKRSSSVLYSSEIASSASIVRPASELHHTPEPHNPYVSTPRIPTPLGLDLSFDFGNFAQSSQNTTSVETALRTSASVSVGDGVNPLPNLDEKKSNFSLRAPHQYATRAEEPLEGVLEGFSQDPPFSRATPGDTVAKMVSQISDHASNKYTVVATPSFPRSPRTSIGSGDFHGNWNLQSDSHIAGRPSLSPLNHSQSHESLGRLNDMSCLELEQCSSNERDKKAFKLVSSNTSHGPISTLGHDQETFESRTSSKQCQTREVSQPLPVKAYASDNVEYTNSTMQALPEASQKLPKISTTRPANSTVLRNLDAFDCSTQSFDSAFATSSARKTPVRRLEHVEVPTLGQDEEENSSTGRRKQERSTDLGRSSGDLHTSPNCLSLPQRYSEETPVNTEDVNFDTGAPQSSRSPTSSYRQRSSGRKHGKSQTHLLGQSKTKSTYSCPTPSISMHGPQKITSQPSCRTPRNVTKELDDNDNSSILPSTQQTPFQAGSIGLNLRALAANVRPSSTPIVMQRHSSPESVQSPWGLADQEQVSTVIPTAQPNGCLDFVDDGGDKLHPVCPDNQSYSWQKAGLLRERHTASNQLDTPFPMQRQDGDELKHTEQQSTQLLYDETNNPWRTGVKPSPPRQSKKRVSFGVLPMDNADGAPKLVSKSILRSPPPANIDYIIGGASDQSREDEIGTSYAVQGKPILHPMTYKPVLSGSKYLAVGSPFKESSPPVAAMAEAFIAADRDEPPGQECNTASGSERFLRPIKETRMNHTARDSNNESPRRNSYSQSPSRGQRTMSQEVALNLDEMIDEMDDFLGGWSVEADLQRESDEAAKESTKSSNRRDRIAGAPPEQSRASPERHEPA
ncbi:hypothetical protein BP5796_08128 [Coleophoma crateriformis]|uniref:Protamine P1 n=1 Tax=Coleophoma crateriformis TaxID=565419 RepID=A0A3D8RE00_9HELO|nr:hypothetical protein BP5796_08128 [Coleophoma crateriformis]